MYKMQWTQCANPGLHVKRKPKPSHGVKRAPPSPPPAAAAAARFAMMDMVVQFGSNRQTQSACVFYPLILLRVFGMGPFFAF